MLAYHGVTHASQHATKTMFHAVVNLLLASTKPHTQSTTNLESFYYTKGIGV